MSTSQKPPNDLQALDDLFLDAVQQHDGKQHQKSERGEKRETAPTGKSAGSAGEESAAPSGRTSGIDALRFEVADSETTVFLKAEDCGPVSAQQILDKLTSKGIVYGIDQQAVAKAEKLLDRFGSIQGSLVVARGVLPKREREVCFSPELEISPPDKNAEGSWTVCGIQLESEKLSQLLDAQNLEEIIAADLTAKAVRAKQVIAILKTVEGVTCGTSVYGLPLKHESPDEFKFGDNINFNVATSSYEATTYGLLLFTGKIVSVVPPVWVAPDRMSAYYINFPQLGTPCSPSVAQLNAMLLLLGIKAGCILKTPITQMCTRLAEGKEVPESVPVAKGRPPVPGIDAHFELLFTTDLLAGVMRADDTINLRERNLVSGVLQGTVVAEKSLASKGVPGYTVTGQALKAANGKDIQIKAGKGIALEESGGKIFFKAASDGNLEFLDRKISIVEIMTLDGDVDYGSGNIDTKTALEVKGSVTTGFTVKTKGSCFVAGGVEQGAVLFIQGDLKVAHGIIGEKTKVVVLGNLEAEFIQDAQVVCRGDVLIRSYLYNSILRATGKLTVTRRQRARDGRAVGGITCTSGGIRLRTAGSPSSQKTTLALLPDPEKVKQLDILNQELSLLNGQITKMLRTLHMDSPDVTQIKAVLSKAPPSQKELYFKILNNLQKFIKAKKEKDLRTRKLKTSIDQQLSTSRIRIEEQLYLGTHIQIGDLHFEPVEDMPPVVFQLKNQKITHKAL